MDASKDGVARLSHLSRTLLDWRREIQEGSGVKFEDILIENRLGFTNYSSGLPVVSGSLVSDDWESVCWRMLGQICDPNISTGPIQRCPLPDRCHSDNPDWPTLERVNRAISFERFDAAPWNRISSDGVRGFIDFEVGNDIEACRNDRMCICAVNDFNCTSPASIAAGSQVITLSGRMHITVSVLTALYLLILLSCSLNTNSCNIKGLNCIILVSKAFYCIFLALPFPSIGVCS